jgi:hypothetical protein
MEMGSPSSRRRWLLLAATVLAALPLAVLSRRYWLADEWAQSSQPENWLRAADLEPGNAENWYRLGRYRQLDFEHMDPALAISYYRRALAIDPRSALFWMDLAATYEMVGEPTRAREAFEKAESVYPISGEVAWRYGNFLLRQEQFTGAFAEIRRAVTRDPKLASLAVSRCWRSTREIEPILNQALPARMDVYLAALQVLVAEHEGDAALAVWQRLIALHPSFELPQAFALLEELIQQNRVEDAKRVWQQALEVAGWTQPELVAGSLVWDGGFEGKFADGGFGWRKRDSVGASTEFDSEIRHAGARSLRITFDGTANLDLDYPQQFVPVEPGRRYRFAAYVRTEGITTNSGVRFQIRDPRQPSDVNILTPNLTGTQPWALEEDDVVTGPQTRLLVIALRRLPSQKFDNKIQGTVWVDEVSLVALPQQVTRRSP